MMARIYNPVWRISLFIWGVLIFSLFLLFNSDYVEKGIYAQSDDVSISASVPEVNVWVQVLARPEKRIPSTNNWSTTGLLRLEPETSGVLYTSSVSIGDNGVSSPHLTGVSQGLYRAYFKGYSHLTKRIDHVAISTDGDVIDFTEGGSFYLLAGDTHHSNDNYVNSLDIATLLASLYTGSVKNDLNYDSVVNSLDLMTLIHNLYASGDT